ncbi:hypothetical protein BGZ98_010265, partial [Dissophora globulifera]
HYLHHDHPDHNDMYNPLNPTQTTETVLASQEVRTPPSSQIPYGIKRRARSPRHSTEDKKFILAPSSQDHFDLSAGAYRTNTADDEAESEELSGEDEDQDDGNESASPRPTPYYRSKSRRVSPTAPLAQPKSDPSSDTTLVTPHTEPQPALQQPALPSAGDKLLAAPQPTLTDSPSDRFLQSMMDHYANIQERMNFFEQSHENYCVWINLLEEAQKIRAILQVHLPPPRDPYLDAYTEFIRRRLTGANKSTP